MSMFAVENFVDLTSFAQRELFNGCAYIWEGLTRLKGFMDGLAYPTIPAWLPLNAPLPRAVIFRAGAFEDSEGCTIAYGAKGVQVEKAGRVLEGASVIMAGVVLQGDRFWFGDGVLVESGAFLQAPAVIGARSQVRQGAYLRGYCLVGQECVVGHVTEMKHSIFLNGAKAGHFAYVGDSILGNDVNLGAGTKLANLRFLRGNVHIRTSEGQQDTGLRKMGAIFGDRAQTGCNSVTNPGTLLGKDSMVLPCVTVSAGCYAAHTVLRR